MTFVFYSDCRRSIKLPLSPLFSLLLFSYVLHKMLRLTVFFFPPRLRSSFRLGINIALS